MSLNKNGFSFDKLLTYGNEKWHDIAQKTDNYFWKEVFISAANVLELLPFTNIDFFGLLPVCNNHLFKINNSTIRESMFPVNNVQVTEFLSSNGNFLSLEEYKQKNITNLNFLNFLSIVKALKDGAKKIKLNTTCLFPQDSPRPLLLHLILFAKPKGCQFFYKIMMSESKINLKKKYDCDSKWNSELERKNAWDSYRTLVKNIRFLNHLKWLQYRILRRIIPTNRILSKFVPSIVNNCDFCNASQDTISHAFFFCNQTAKFWGELSELLRQLGFCYDLNEKLVLFGDYQSAAMSFKNLIILFGKKYIWDCKAKKNRPNIRTFLNFVRPLIESLMLTYSLKNLEAHDEQSWVIFHDHLISGRG